MFTLLKYLVTSVVVIAVSEVAKRSDKSGAIIASLPLVTILTLIWLYIEKQPQEKIANHAYYTFWYVIPTLPMFLVFPKLLYSLGFWPAIVMSVGVSCVCFILAASLLRNFGINLL